MSPMTITGIVFGTIFLGAPVGVVLRARACLVITRRRA